ncbi:hypothetical protein H4R33_004074 [Dimargaris cristalligena]|uniref:Homeodomain-like protein n=1 Tax=Dimargaris cristalligena TaxID=215637 RepID=A0A4P9ZXG8_9FUNG|nr:hypothetical protein H4R33_004074 [Dimargaris cristalligena]RKP38353.1 hypothetical protein BJ085DRAFT_37502 [Dimargaris cristalligena]|eukprot:RKP38353.1 hypothetical protein BJ085DRAFT_37502 [Dimargaris cristalligena]
MLVQLLQPRLPWGLFRPSRVSLDSLVLGLAHVHIHRSRAYTAGADCGSTSPMSTPCPPIPKTRARSSRATTAGTSAASPPPKLTVPPAFLDFPLSLSYSTFQIFASVLKLLNRGLAWEKINVLTIKRHFPYLASINRIDKVRLLIHFKSGRYRLSWFMAVDSDITTENLDQFVEWEQKIVDSPVGKACWTPKELARLTEAMEKYGSRAWDAIAAHVRTKGVNACKTRSYRLLKQVTSVPPPTEAFLKELDQRVQQYNWDWSLIRQHYPHRDMCRLRNQYWTWRRPNLPSFRVWSPDELDRLRAAVAQIGSRSWLDVADRVGGTKSGEQCRTQWIRLNSPDPSWPPSPDECAQLLFYMAVHHPHLVQAVSPSILHQLPAVYRTQGLAPHILVNWKMMSQWMTTSATSPRTNLQCMNIWKNVSRLLAKYGALDSNSQEMVWALSIKHGLPKAHALTAKVLKVPRQRARRYLKLALLTKAFQQLLKDPPSLLGSQ